MSYFMPAYRGSGPMPTGFNPTQGGRPGMIGPNMGPPPANNCKNAKNAEEGNLVISTGYPSDPVTKAVVDNIMGKLSTKKPRIALRCDVCNVEFSGHVVLETHLAGSKHAKKVKSQEILKQLQDSGQVFTKDDKTNILKCEICDVVVNSSQQLQTHLAGNKHKQKAAKRGAPPAVGGSASKMMKTEPVSPETSGSAPEGSPAASATATTATTASTESTAASTTSTVTDGTGGSGTENGDKPMDIPPGVQKVVEGKITKFICTTCKVTLNSEIQLQQHLGSRKHKDRLSGNFKARGRGRPWMRGRAGFKGMGQGRGGGGANNPSDYTQPLTSTFVPGGAMACFVPKEDA